MQLSKLHDFPSSLQNQQLHYGYITKSEMFLLVSPMLESLIFLNLSVLSVCSEDLIVKNKQPVISIPSCLELLIIEEPLHVLDVFMCR